MSLMPERILSFERCLNFRDLGGYAGRDGRPVQWRRLFRSMTPQYMSDLDAVAVAELEISLVVDLRGAAYTSSGPVPGPRGTRLTVGPDPVQRTEAEAERYRLAPPEEALPGLLETHGRAFAGALQAMAERPDANVLFHCRLGKDRTGVFAAVLLKLLGVSDDDVVRDYMLTAEQEPAARRLLVECETDDTISKREPRVAKEPPSRAAIEGVLQRLASRYGGAYGYFIQHGVQPEALSAFIESRLEPPASDLRDSTSSTGDSVPA